MNTLKTYVLGEIHGSFISEETSNTFYNEVNVKKKSYRLLKRHLSSHFTGMKNPQFPRVFLPRLNPSAQT